MRRATPATPSPSRSRPAPPSDTAHDYTFFGWAAAPQTDTDSRPDFSAAGAEQVFTQAEQTYYALYYYKVDDPTPSATSTAA